MKKLMVAIAAAAISFAGFAEGSWFTAGFTEGGASTGGAWLSGQDGVTEPTFNEETLVLEDVEATAPVVFKATDSKETDEATVVFRSAVNFVGFDELPAIDATAKAGVCALTDGNYWVVSYDSEGVTNKWVDTGITAILDSADTVTVSVSTNVAVYSFGNADGFVCPINGSEFQEVCYSGNGTVTSLEADHAFNGLAIILPVIDGLIVSCDKTRAAVGSEVTVNFAAGTKIPSKGSAVYIVQENGSLTIKAGDSEPEAYDPAAKIDDELYLTFAAAYEAASADDTIELCTSQVVDADAGITIDKNIEVNLAGFAMTNVNDFTISEAKLTVTGDGEWVIAALVSVADTAAELDISAIKWSVVNGGYLTGFEGAIYFGADCDSPNKMFHDGVLIGEDAETPAELSIIVGESGYDYDSGADVPRYVNSEEIAYAYIGATGEGYYDSFATVQDAIDVSDAVYLSNYYDCLPSDEDLEFNANTIVYACNDQDDLLGSLTVDGGEVEWDDTLGDNGGWKAVTGEPAASYEVSWSGAENAKVFATVHGTQIDNGESVDDGEYVQFEVTPDEGYKFADASYEGWLITEDGKLTCTEKVDGAPISLVIPSATEIIYVAQIDDALYETLAEAVDAATNGQTVKILDDLELTEGIELAADKEITLDLNGKTLRNTVAGYTIDNAGKLTIVDNADVKGTITHVEISGTQSTIRNLGVLTISDITVGGDYIGIKNDEGAGCNGGKGYGELVLNGVTFNGNDQAVQNWGHATINGGTFGGAVFTWADAANKGNVAGKTVISNGTFNASVAAVQQYRDGTGWPSDTAKVTICGGTFEAKAYGTYTTNYVGDKPEKGVIVVPTDSTAKFKYDETPYATIEEGYGFVLEGGYYVIAESSPIPPLPPEPTPANVSNAVDKAGFVDQTVMDVIGGNAEKYNALKTWAGTVQGGEQAVVGSPFAAKSFELSSVVASPTLFTEEPTLTITSIEQDADSKAQFSIKLTDGATGDKIALLEAIKDYVKVSENLSVNNPWSDVKPEQVTATVTEGIATVVVTPSSEATQYFMKVVVK